MPAISWNLAGTATILCADLSLKSISSVSGVPCSTSSHAVLAYNGANLVVPLRGATAAGLAGIPYVLYPRNTLLLEDHPLIRWHETAASGYRVSILAGGKELWATEVFTSGVRYPDDAPALTPHVDYLVKVVDRRTGVASTNDPARGLGFQLVSAEEWATLDDRRQQILALDALDEAARQFALAIYYTGGSASASGFRPLGAAWLLLRARG